MPHNIALINTLAIGLGTAFVFGWLASRLHLPPLLGYLLAGIAVGPFTPGFVADVSLAPQLAEIGVILLMFGVGMHFSIADLMAVKSIAVPGALLQMVTLTIVLGKSLASFVIVRALGYPLGSALTVSAALAQIGEFSFILAGLGISLRLLPEEANDLILAGALLSITLNPLMFKLLTRWGSGAGDLRRACLSRPGLKGFHS